MSAVGRGALAAGTRPQPAHAADAPSGARRTLRSGAVATGAIVALATFSVALDGGGYDVSSRAALGVALSWAVLLCVALGLWPRAPVPRPALIVGGLLALLALWTGLSAIWAPAAETAVVELERVLVYLGVFAVALLAARRTAAIEWCDGLAVGIAAVAALALLSRCFPGLTSADDQVIGALPASFPQRLTYPLGYWNGLAIFVALAVPLLLRAAVSDRHAILRAIAVAPFPVVAGVVYLTSSRGGVAVALVGAVAFLALSPRRFLTAFALVAGGLGAAAAVAVLRARHTLVEGPVNSSVAAGQGRSAALIVLALCVGVACVYGVGAALAPRRVRVSPKARAIGVGVAAVAAIIAVVAASPGDRFDTFKQPPAQSIPGQQEEGYVAAHLTSGGGAGRWQFWSAAVDEWHADPVTGGGAGSYESYWAQNGEITYFVRDAHSLWLETLGELGIVGFLLIAGAFATSVAVGATRWRRLAGDDRGAAAALLAVVLGFMVGAALDWVWEMTAVGAVGVLALGLLVGPATQAAEAGPAAEAGRPLHPLPVLARVLAAIAAAATLLFAGTMALAERQLDRSRSAAGRADTRAAVDDAAAARHLEPWSSAPPLQLALLKERTGDLPSALVWTDRAIAKNPADWRLWLVRARIAVKLGDDREARRSYGRARGLNPRSPIFAQR